MTYRYSYILRCFLLFFLVCYSVNAIYPYIEQQIKGHSGTFVRGDSLSRLVKVRPQSSFGVLDYIRRSTPVDSTFLVFRRSDFMAYGERKFLINYDPRLAGFYSISDVDLAIDFLQDLGVDYFFLTPNPHPTVYRSCVTDIIGDPRLASLEYEAGGYRLFKLHRVPQDKKTIAVLGQDSLAQQEWSLQSGGERSIVVKDQVGHIPASTDKVIRQFYSGKGPLSFSPSYAFSQKSIIYSNTFYTFSAKIRGSGQCDVHLAQYDTEGAMLSFSGMWTGFLSESALKQIGGVTRTNKAAAEYRLVFVFSDNRKILVEDVALDMVVSSDVLQRTDDFQNEIFKKTIDTRKWATVYESDFEAAEVNDLQSIGWSTYSEGRVVTWPWGRTETSHGGNYSVYLEQPDNRSYWLYTGAGNVTTPAGASFDNSLQASHKEQGEYKLSCYIKGSGQVALYVWWYDSIGQETNTYLGQYFLPSAYSYMERTFELPAEAVEYRVAFLLRANKDQQSKIYLDDLKVELSEAP